MPGYGCVMRFRNERHSPTSPQRRRSASGWLRVGGLLAGVALLAACSSTPSPATSPSAASTPTSAIETPASVAPQPQVATTNPEPAAIPSDPASEVPEPQVASTPPAVATVAPSVAPQPTDGISAPEFVAMCPYDDGSGVISNLPCDSPQFGSMPPVTPVEPPTITCETPCTTSGCQQYKDVVLNC